MKHVINLLIAAGVFVFAGYYAYFISFNMPSVTGINLVQKSMLIAFAIQWLAFIPAFILKTEKFYDLTGSITYISVMTFILWATQSLQELHVGNIVLGLAVIVWAMRLGSFLFSRIAKDGEDKRFRSIKTSFSQFFMTWTLQGLWVFICSSAALVAISRPDGIVINAFFYMGLGVFIFGFIYEVIADNQKSAFRSNPKNKDAFITEGLWARSRHPNYFGEITLWTGITVMSISSFSGLNYLALFSPIFTYILLNYVSGVRMLEDRGNKKWGHLEAYQNYRKTTPKLIPKLN